MSWVVAKLVGLASVVRADGAECAGSSMEELGTGRGVGSRCPQS